MYELNTMDTILMFTDIGNYLFVPVHEIVETKWKELGKHIKVDNHNQNIEPLPPFINPIAIPLKLPTPILAANAKVNVSNGLIPLLFVLSFFKTKKRLIIFIVLLVLLDVLFFCQISYARQFYNDNVMNYKGNDKIRNFVIISNIGIVTTNLETAKRALATYNNLFGQYPYRTLVVAKTPFLFGGMEYPNSLDTYLHNNGSLYMALLSF